MSTLNVNTITPNSGTTVTIGGSGDTITVPSGATLAVASGATISNSGTASGFGKVLQVVEGAYSTQIGTTSTTYIDTSLTASITPSSASNKILVIANVSCHCVSGGAALYHLYRNDTTQIGDPHFMSSASGAQAVTMSLTYLDSPSTTSSTAYDVYMAAVSGGGTATINFNNRGSRITLLEIAG